MYESESEKEHSESEFYYPEDDISGDEVVFNANDKLKQKEHCSSASKQPGKNGKFCVD